MFSRLEISIWKAFFWPVANLAYWALIFLSWWDTRLKVFLGTAVLERLIQLRSFSASIGNIEELRSQAQIAVAQSGAMHGEFMMIPLVMSVVMFIVPFVVRRDFKGPVTGFFVLPAMTALCYFFASFLNLIVVAAMSAGIHYLLFQVPGPDIGMFMVHPLYLIFPILRSVPGFASQCLYLVYTASVLVTESVEEPDAEDAEDGEIYESRGEDDWDKSACLMEMDRLSRILNTKFEEPPFMSKLRGDVAAYVNSPGQVSGEVRRGVPHYKIVLTETRNSLRALLAEDPKAPGAFLFIVGEMERMDYITADDARAMRAEAGSSAPAAPKEPEKEPEARAAEAEPLKIPEARTEPEQK
jgi:hypothetical protein